MLGVTLFNIFFTPVSYVVIRRLTGRGKVGPVPTLAPWGGRTATPAVSATALKNEPGNRDG
jgi:hypothetical protein